MKIYKQSIEQDSTDIRCLKQMTMNAEMQLRFNQIDNKEYQYILSKVIERIEVLENKYGLD